QGLTQFSIDYRDDIGASLEHSEFLADASRDCQRELASALIDALAQDGSIFVYSSFEKTQINRLSEAFAELSEPLDAVCQRLVDLKTIISDHIYHPQFRGSYSIKHVLPALVPDLNYANLDIGDGSTAIVRFARM